ncbi:MAG: UxaA family hydrolase [Alphaproteobacteria bacterium]
MSDGPSTLRLHEKDNVVVAVRDLAPGASLGEGNLFARENVPRGHKVATAPAGEGDPIRKYNQIIGFASTGVTPGEHVHTHNLEFRPFERDHAFGVDARPTDYVPEDELATFDGIIRPDGRIATRNFIGVLTSVNCSATVARYVSDRFRIPGALDDYPNVDGVVALTHGSGCGMASEGEGMDHLRRTLAGYARHPNFAGVVLIGLGCEANQIPRLMEVEELYESDLLHTLVMQEEGGTSATVREGIERVTSMLPRANEVTRQPVPASHLSLSLQCGGSDGYSGITANPALGAAADILVRHGGTAVLSETPEIYGAEHLLTGRAVSGEVARKLLDLIAWWENYTAANDGSMDNNPSPGNKEGGLTTILEKSLGAAAKGGTTNLVDVYRYAEPLTRKGFVFMDSPGYDPASVTGQVASGCNIVCFTTGRGSCFGARPAPSLKLATNTPMYERMVEDMDINCGEIVDGKATVAEMGQRIFDLMLETASGKQTKSELLGYGEDEFTPWTPGAVM